jgi:serine/threonine protein kinase
MTTPTVIIIVVAVIVGVCSISILFYYLTRRIRGDSQKRARVHAKQAFLERHTQHLRGNFVQMYSHPQKQISEDYDMFLDQELGRGGCGFVVVAESTTSAEQFAIKIVDKQNMEQGRIEREISFLKDVDHPNIVRLFSVYDSPKRVYFVMELCAGGHLGNLLARQSLKHLDEDWARILTRQLCSAVCHLHNRGICHRDIKLQNILLDSSNDRNAQVKLIDFGYSVRYVGACPMRTTVGTPYTCAPEVIRECYDEKCDIWSVGVCVFIMLCGKKPFDNLVVEGPLLEAGKATMMTNILAGRYSLQDRAFTKVSNECLLFIQTLLNRDYIARVSAPEVMSLRWLNMLNSSNSAKLRETSSDRSATITTPQHQPLNRLFSTEKSKFAFKRLAVHSERNELQRTGAMALAFGFQPREAVNMRSLFQSCKYFQPESLFLLAPRWVQVTWMGPDR